MSAATAFEIVREEQIAEVGAYARLYRHKKTGAELLSLATDDENKVFGIAFKTPPTDSTGIAHILEHSVLCGSERFPVKKPFVEMLKGSVHTFLNAMTYPDKTIYPVASQNLTDFYNLATVYLDAVLFPLLTEQTFQQEGWHYELESPDAPLIYKGVVFNEMKGAYSSPDAALRWSTMAGLYPDTTYGHSSGGDPRIMPQLDYAQFRAFHSRYYHPSNAQIIFYGDDPEAQRLELADSYLSRFERAEKAGPIPLQPPFDAPRQAVATYPADDNGRPNAFVTLNWVWPDTTDPVEIIARSVLASALVGTSAAPLRRALTESGLGESVIGGLTDQMLQPYFSAGLRGTDAAKSEQIEALILATLEDLTTKGFDVDTVEATVNSLEFRLREMNTGGYPRGIAYFTAALGDWLHGRDPIEALKFDDALTALKARIFGGERVLEEMIAHLLLNNPHRLSMVLNGDSTQAEREAEAERAHLASVRETLDADAVNQIIATTNALKTLQNTPDRPEDLRKIPTLSVDDLPREITRIATDTTSLAGVETLVYDQPTNGIIYLDLAFDFKGLPKDLVPYLPLFARALTQTGAGEDDFVALTQRIGRLTGGLTVSPMVSSTVDGDDTVAKLVLRGKAVAARAPDLLDIMGDILDEARLDNRTRIQQMVLEDKARMEASLVPSGHVMAMTRLRAGFSEAGWLAEQFGGISYLLFLRRLAEQVEHDWSAVHSALEAIRRIVISRAGAIANVTTERALWGGFAPALEAFLADLPITEPATQNWSPLPLAQNEGLIIPAQVNYVAKGASLRALGHQPSAALTVITRHLGTSYLWDKVRVEGGAYGGFASFDPFVGAYVFGSYRDPNLIETLDIFDGAARFLEQGIDEDDLKRSIIGTIGDMDGAMLPDAKGFSAFQRRLVGASDSFRQARRDQVLQTTQDDVRRAAALLADVARQGAVVVLGSAPAISTANRARNEFLAVTKVL